MEDSGAENDVNYNGPAQEVSVSGPETTHGIFLAKNVAAFCLCPKGLLETKSMGFGLKTLAEKMSRLPKVDSTCSY